MRKDVITHFSNSIIESWPTPRRRQHYRHIVHATNRVFRSLRNSSNGEEKPVENEQLLRNKLIHQSRRTNFKARLIGKVIERGYCLSRATRYTQRESRVTSTSPRHAFEFPTLAETRKFGLICVVRFRKPREKRWSREGARGTGRCPIRRILIGLLQRDALVAGCNKWQFSSNAQRSLFESAFRDLRRVTCVATTIIAMNGAFIAAERRSLAIELFYNSRRIDAPSCLPSLENNILGYVGRFTMHNSAMHPAAFATLYTVETYYVHRASVSWQIN